MKEKEPNPHYSTVKCVATSESKFSGPARGEGGLENKDSQTHTLKIKLGSGGALLSDGDEDLKSYPSSLYLYLSHYQVKDYTTIILCIQASYRN